MTNRTANWQRTVIVGTIVLAIHCASTAYVERRGGPGIVDLGFEMLPEFAFLPDGAEHILPYLYSAAALWIFGRDRNSSNSSKGSTDPNRLHMFEIYIRQFITIMGLRAFTISVTIFPATAPCGPPSEALHFVGGCYDKIFSGHQAYLFLAVMNLHRRGHSGWHYLAVAAEALLLVGVRAHYTVDVVLGMIIAHLLAETTPKLD
jgi:hypothetical protein